MRYVISKFNPSQFATMTRSVCERLEVDDETVYGKTRKGSIVPVRYALWLLAYEKTDVTAYTLASMFNRTRAMIHDGLRTAKDMRHTKYTPFITSYGHCQELYPLIMRN